MRLRLVVSLAAAVPSLLAAQAAPQGAAASSNPVSDAFRMQVARYARILPAAADAVPADKYSYKPTPAQMSFGEIVAHLADGNDELCSAVAGTTAPARAKITKDSPKDSLVAALKSTFGYCTSAMANLTDASLSKSITMFGTMKTTTAGALLITVGDWADHYSQSAIYMRLNGMLPPTAQPRPTTP